MDNQAAAKIKNAEMKKVLAKYLPNLFQSSVGFNIFSSPADFSSGFLFPAYGLNSQLTALKNEYVNKLPVISYSSLNKSNQLDDENAKQLIEIAEGYANEEIEKFFGNSSFSSYKTVESVIVSGIAATVEITEGQLIGYAGRSGNVPRTQLASEDHVHFGVSVTLVRPTSQSPAWKNPVMYLNECVLSTERG